MVSKKAIIERKIILDMRQMHINIKDKGNFIVKFAIILCFICTIIKCFYEGDRVAGGDEAFYLAQANRFLQGDVFFCDDWMPQSLYSIFAMPFLFIYKCIFHTYDGIVLASRLFITILTLGIALFVKHVLDRKGWNTLVSFLIACGVIVFCPNNAPGFSYYSLGFLFSLLSVIVLYGASNKKDIVLSGLFSGMAIVCNPFLVITYIFLLIYFLFISNDKKNVLIHFLTVFCEGITYIGFIILRAPSINSIFYGVQMYLNNPGHEIISTGESGSSNIYLDRLIDCIEEYYHFCFGTLLICAIGTVIYRIIKRKIPVHYKMAYFCIQTLYAFVILVRNLVLSNNIGDSLFLIALYFINLLPIMEFSKKEPVRYLIIPGVGISLAFMMASLMSMPTAGIGGFIIIIGMIPLLKQFLDENVKFLCLERLFYVAFYIIPLIGILYLRMFYAFLETPVSVIDTYVNDGPLQGCYYWKSPDEINETVNYVNNLSLTKDDYIMSDSVYAYLYTDAKCASWTAWCNIKGIDTHQKYYEMHEDRKPDVVILVYNYSESQIDDYLDIFGGRDNYVEEGYDWGRAFLLK